MYIEIKIKELNMDILINVINGKSGEIRQFLYKNDFEKTIRKISYLKNKMKIGNDVFQYEFTYYDENLEIEQYRTFEDFSIFKIEFKNFLTINQ